MSKILIIGGSGLVGSTLSKYAINDYDLQVTHNENELDIKNIPCIKINIIQDLKPLENIIESWMPDTVVHTAAYPSVDFCETNPKEADYMHINTSQEISKMCHKINSKLIYISTDAVFDGKKDRKYNENDLSNPLSHYGKTKLQAEKIILNTSEKNVILRSTVIYGWYKRSRFTNWVLSTLNENKIVTGFTDQHNTPTLVDDMAKVILKIIKNDKKGLYHAVGPTCLTRYDFAIKLAKKFGFDVNLIKPVTSLEKKQDAPRPQNGCLDNSKLENELNFKFTDIDKGIDHIFDKFMINQEFF